MLRPVCFVVTDQRPPEERQGDASGYYIYTIDNTNGMPAAQGIGVDICAVMERKGLTEQARVALPGELPPTNCLVVHLTLLSWYGRLPRSDLITDKVLGALLARPVYAEGRCRFSSILTYATLSKDLGVSEGKAVFQVSRHATIESEGNRVSAAAADKAIAQFLSSFESWFSNFAR